MDEQTDIEAAEAAEAVAIIGLAGRFPGARGVDAFWKNLREGIEGISVFSPEELRAAGVPERLIRDPRYVPARGVLPDVDGFDAGFFGFSDREALELNPQFRIFLECAWEALERGAYLPETFDGRIGLFAGAGSNDYVARLEASEERAESYGSFARQIFNDKDFLATRTSYQLRLTGPSVTVLSACSTSLVAVHMAAQSLLNGECDMALAGGVTIFLPQRVGYLYQEGGIGSPDGHCRAFDAKAGGCVGGNGAAVVLLKPLADALRDGDHVHSAILGSAINNDGDAKVGYTAPSVAGQAAVVAEALSVADVGPEEISYIETHGTGTPMGDPIEIEALRQVFEGVEAGSCRLGAVKTSIGHLDCAAGAAGLIKTALALDHREIPPSLHFETPNPEAGLEGSPFTVNASLQPWESGDGPRRAGVSSFGIGGTNAHVVLEEAPETTARPHGRPAVLLPLSARSEEAVTAAARNLAGHLETHPELDVADVAYTLQVGRRGMEHRRAVVCTEAGEAARLLRSEGELITGVAADTDPPGVVFLLPGQGAQRPGMGRELYATEPTFRGEVDRCAEVLAPELGLDIRELLFSAADGEDEARDALSETSVTQPALFVLEYALARWWRSLGVEPAALLGHSVGEYVAACLAGVFSLEDGLRLVARRGRLMQELPRGGMLAVSLTETDATARLGDGLWLAAVNGPERCTISGTLDAIARLEATLVQEGVGCRRLVTSHGFHSGLVEPILETFRAAVADLSLAAPEIPFLSNVTGTWITAAQATDPSYWADHLRLPVRFADALTALEDRGLGCFLEVGPGAALCSLARGQLAVRKPLAVASLGPRSSSEPASLLQALGQLWTRGIAVDWQRLYESGERRRVPLPTYPFERRRFWPEEPASQSPTSRAPAVDTSIAQPPSSPESHPVTQADGVSAEGAAPLEQVLETGVTHSHSQDRRQRLADRVAEILGTALKTKPADLERQTTFLELGADSLLLLQVSQAIEEQLGARVPFRMLLDAYPTVASLAEHLDDELPAEVLAVPDPPPPALDPPPVPVSMASLPESAEASSTAVGDSAVERLLAQQLQAFTDLANRQLEVLSASRGAVPAQEGAGEASASRAASPVIPAASRPVSAVAEGAGPQPAASRDEVFIAYKPVEAGPRGGLTERQQEHLEWLIDDVSRLTGASKERTDHFRRYFADNRLTAGFRLLYKELMYQILVDRGEGAHIWDVDGNEYVDISMGFGALLYGHSPKFILDAVEEEVKRGLTLGPQSRLAGEVAQLLCETTGNERAAFCNSGTEAVMTAIRLARTVTRRDKIALFAGSFHGTFDGILARARRPVPAGEVPESVPLAPGVPASMVQDAQVLYFGSDEALAWIEEHGEELAAVLVEPLQSRRPDMSPEHFLREVRRITEASGTVLIFDEVVTGFRMHIAGVQAMWNIDADITTYGKAACGGLPIGIVAGRAKYLDAIDGGVWQYGDASFPRAQTTFFAGTFCKHPFAMAAARAVLHYLRGEGKDLQVYLEKRTRGLTERLDALFQAERVPLRMTQFGSLFRFAYPSSLRHMDLFFYHLLRNGVYVWEGRNCYLSKEHSDEDLDRLLEAVQTSVRALKEAGFLPVGPEAPEPDFSGGGRSSEGSKPVLTGGAPGAGDAAALAGTPLTEGQRGLWILAQLGNDASMAYNEAVSLELAGDLDEAAFRDAFALLVQRHEALRTRFDREGREQFVDPDMEYALPFEDLPAASVEADATRAWIDGFIRQPFDFVAGPLYRAALLRLASGRRLFLFVAHHIIVDGWSMSVLFSELGVIYDACRRGASPELPTPMQYRDYAAVLEQRQEGRVRERARQYWVDRFTGRVPVLELPTDRPRPPLQDFDGGRVSRCLDPSMHEAVRTFSAARGMTPFMTLLAVFKVLLHRLSGQTELVVGMDSAGQSTVGNGDLVGHCVALLPVRSTLGGDPLFDDFLAALKRDVLDAFEHQDLSLVDLLRELDLPRDTSRSPLVTAEFNLDKTAPTLTFADLEVKARAHHSGYSKFELSLNALQTGEGLLLDCDFHTRLFDAATVERWLGFYEVLLEGVLAGADRRVSALPLMPEAEREQVLHAWNETGADYPMETTYGELFAAQVERRPAAVAAVAGDERLTYGELDRRSTALAIRLVEAGIGVDTVVPILGRRGLEFLTGVLGILKAGAAYLPLDPLHPASRHAQVLEQITGPWLIVTEGFDEAAADAATLLSRPVEVLPVDGPEPEAGGTLPAPDPDSLAYVIFTSGSTGVPKGVMLHHRGMVNHIFVMVAAFDLDERDVVAQNASQCFDISVWQLLAPLVFGGVVQILDDEVSHDPVRLRRAVTEGGTTILELVPSLMRLLLEGDEDAADEGLAALRWLLPTGEALPPALARQWLERYPGVPLTNAYGPTECSDDVTLQVIREPLADSVVNTPIGGPVDNLTLYLVDRCFRPLPIGVWGEIVIGGVGVGRGYLGKARMTAERFVPDPFSAEPGTRLYRSGDLGRWLTEGTVEYLGRVDFQVKVRGHRIELGEIEAVLDAHPAVDQAVVAVREARPGERRLVAYLVFGEAGEEATAPAALREYLKGRLPEYMVPSFFVALDELPLTPNGKVDRKALPEPEAGCQARAVYEAPATKVETLLARVWAEVLGLERVGLRENFFDLGGDSILGIRIAARCNDAGLPLSPQHLFRFQTVGELAADLGTPPGFEAEISGEDAAVPLTPVQEWFFEQAFDRSEHWNLPLLLAVNEPLDGALLGRALNAVVERHGALRQSFESDGEGWSSYQHGIDEGVELRVLDLSGEPEAVWEEALRTAGEELQTALDPAAGKLVSGAFISLGEARPGRLLLAIHHLAVDLSSLRILSRDLEAAYRQLRGGEAVDLGVAGASWRRWAQRLAEHVATGEPRHEQEYWEDVLGGAVAPLPVDLESGSNREEDREWVSLRLGAEETEGLLREAPKLYRMQTSEVLLAALAKAFHAWTGQPRLLLDLEGHGREELFDGVRLANTVGWFTAPYPVALDLSGAPSPKEALVGTKEVLRAVPRGGIGYGLLRYGLGELREAPRAEVSFNFIGRSLAAPTESLFTVANGDVGPPRAPRATRSHVLEVTGRVLGGSAGGPAELEMVWGFSNGLHRRSTIESLARTFQAELRALIEHCQSPDAGSLSPSDFSLANLDQGQLDGLLSKIQLGDG